MKGTTQLVMLGSDPNGGLAIRIRAMTIGIDNIAGTDIILPCAHSATVSVRTDAVDAVDAVDEVTQAAGLGKAGMMVGDQGSERSSAEREAPGDGHIGGIR
jgi:hypothetical protein